MICGREPPGPTYVLNGRLTRLLSTPLAFNEAMRPYAVALLDAFEDIAKILQLQLETYGRQGTPSVLMTELYVCTDHSRLLLFPTSAKPFERET